MQTNNGVIYANCYINGKFTKGTLVQIVERIKRGSREFIRAKSPMGWNLVAPAHLFKFKDEKSATLVATDLLPTVQDKLNELKIHWAKS